ncbi:cyclase family protein [Cupriavidus basilensis]
MKPSDLPDSEGWAIERVQLSTHNGTHLDAPYHFHSSMNESLGQRERAITIDEVPLEWCFQPGVKLDFTGLDEQLCGHRRRCRGKTQRVSGTLKPLEIVVVNTREQVGATASLTMSPPAAAWDSTPPCTCLSMAYA